MSLVTEPAPPPGGLRAARRMNPGTDTRLARDARDEEQARLVAAMAGGDKAAMAGLYDQLSGPLYSLALQMLGSQAEAEDLTQDVFLQLWRAAASFNPTRGSVFSWAITLTRNRAIDRLRTRKRRGEILAEVGAELRPAADGATGDSADALWLREKAGAVRAALASLSAEQKTAIELAFFSGLTQQEIAERLGEPLGTVKARIRRGLLQLRDSLSSRL